LARRRYERLGPDTEEVASMQRKGTFPPFAPFQSCISCLKGDTQTAVYVEGEAEWHIAALMHWAGLPSDQADATFLYYCEHELGCEPGLVPDGRFRHGFRLCRDCATRTGAKVVAVGEAGPVYVQPEE
jgi:hypothetical protein